MLTEVPIAVVEVRALTHATEDWNKVERAVKNLVAEDFWEEAEVVKQNLEGYYGNPITLLKARSDKQRQARDLVMRLFSSLSSLDRNLLLDTFQSQIDEKGNLYVRFDKQAAYLGNPSLGGEDAIRVQIKLPLPKKRRDQITEAFRQIILAASESKT